MRNPLVSVVIPSYEQARFLGETIESVLSQDYEPIEVLVVDGGSEDGTAEVLERYADRLAYHVSEPDEGQSDAINKGFARARGEWIGWLNSDDLLLPGAVSALMAYAAEHPDARWLAGGGWFVDEEGERLHHYDAPPGPLRAEDLSPWTGRWFAQPGTLMRRDLYDEAGGQVRRDLAYAMDLELWLRLGSVAPLHTVAADVSAYRLHVSSKTMAERADMEVEIVEVLLERLGWESARDRVRFLAEDHFDLSRRHQELLQRLTRPTGLVSLGAGWLLRRLHRLVSRIGSQNARGG